MRLAVVHYHFRRGGVTRVVENAVAALEAYGVETLALSGEAYSGGALPAHRVVPGLGYQNEASGDTGRALATALKQAAREHFGALPDVWHIHNHSLGKNADCVGALHCLLAEGARVLLQIHDFAEDGRPANYARLRAALGEQLDQRLYPLGAQIHYAVLNGRDRAILARAGIPPDQLHSLPNPVATPHLPDTLPSLDLDRGARSFFLYPTRAIRRKNVGELLLHAALGKETRLLGTTLRPENPEWRAIHDRWETLAVELDLPVRFGLGETHPFEALMGSADALVTTSVAEGFGLAFLEPYLFRKAVVGRNLPEITNDFSTEGVDLGHLYPALPVPREAIDANLLRERVSEALSRSYMAYARPLPVDAVDAALDAMGDASTIEFGRIDEDLQEQVVRHALVAPKAFAHLKTALEIPSPTHVADNATVIRDTYSLEAYGKRLFDVLSAVTNTTMPSPKGSFADAGAVLDAFLSPANITLLRT